MIMEYGLTFKTKASQHCHHIMGTASGLASWITVISPPFSRAQLTTLRLGSPWLTPSSLTSMIPVPLGKDNPQVL